MSWKWKLTITLVLLALFLTGFLLSDSGYKWMREHIVKQMQELPAAEQRESPLADSFMTLAWFRGSICLDEPNALEMYKDFCGYGYPAKAGNGVAYMEAALQTGKLQGLCSPKGDTGWGPEHPRAPEAFYQYLEIKRRDSTSQNWKGECSNYYRLFYTWMRYYSKSRKPHPLFNKYWPAIRKKAENGEPGRFPYIGEVDRNAPLAAPYKEETPP
jgi:hypothetical protein